ncbi:hypothetical protein C0J52_11446 [Blattella germanica]|nr:hypothetical protein C0J52_11446 [Blattella germanica]
MEGKKSILNITQANSVRRWLYFPICATRRKHLHNRSATKCCFLLAGGILKERHFSIFITFCLHDDNIGKGV